MRAAPGRRDPDDMNMSQVTTGPASQYRTVAPRRRRALLAAPAIGVAATAASGFAALVATAVASALLIGANANPRLPANAYWQAHYTDIYLWSHPLYLAACCALIAGATALATFRRNGLAALLLGTAAVLPWIPAMAFLSHIWQLAPAG
jgi:hypothetical protein